MGGVDLVHGLEIGHVLQIDGGLQQPAEIDAGDGEHGLQVLEDLPGLGFHAAIDQLAGFRVNTDLSGYEQHVPPAHGLGIWPQGLGRPLGLEGMFFHLHLLAYPSY